VNRIGGIAKNRSNSIMGLKKNFLHSGNIYHINVYPGSGNRFTLSFPDGFPITEYLPQPMIGNILGAMPADNLQVLVGKCQTVTPKKENRGSCRYFNRSPWLVSMYHTIRKVWSISLTTIHSTTDPGINTPLFPMWKPVGLKNRGLMHHGRLRLFKPTFQWKERGIKGWSIYRIRWICTKI